MSFRRYRETGLQKAIANRSDPTVTLEIARVPRFDKTARLRAADAMLGQSIRPSAILALTDEIALSVIEQARILQLPIPEELSVIGFDNLPATAWVQPSLTTFDQRVRETAMTLAHRLIDLIDGDQNGPTTPSQNLITATMIGRDSHGPVPSTTCVHQVP